jgi:hypothetical protein
VSGYSWHVAATCPMAAKYIADIKGAREMTLIGAANYEYWQRQLSPEVLVPVKLNNCAEVLLSAVELKWMGVRFRELSVSISVHDANRPSEAGLYLPAAFNTSRVFTFFERNWFHTPYCHAQVDVSTGQPWSIQLADEGSVILQVARSGTTPPNGCHTLFEGPIYLPSRQAGSRRRFEVFFARLAGETQIVPFDAERDSLQMAESARHPILKMLIESNFTGVQWRVRSNATHARSKTYERGMSP